MPMMLMVIICVFVYFISFALILFYHKYINPKYAILFFMITNTVLFAGYCINEYYRKGHFEFLTFDQISPFMFTMLPLSFFLNEKIKDAYYSTAAYLCLGMFIAMLVSPQEAYLSSYKADATLLYVFDTLLHLNFSLFGLYLFISETVTINLKNLYKAGLFLYSVITFAVICNFLFHKNYFGMGYYSKYGIYMIRIFETYWATLIAYIFGVALVLILGYEFNYLILRLSSFNKNFKNKPVKEKKDTFEKLENDEI